MDFIEDASACGLHTRGVMASYIVERLEQLLLDLVESIDGPEAMDLKGKDCVAV